MPFRRLVSYGEETTYGTAPASITDVLGWVTTFNGGVELVSETTAIANAERKKKTLVHGHNVNPSVTFYPLNGKPFKYALGVVTDTDLSGVGSGPWQHDITIASDYKLPSITLLEHRIGTPNHGYQYTGCRIESMEARWEVDRELEVTLDFVGKTPTKVTSLPSVTFPTEEPYKAEQITTIINGTAYDYVTGGSIRLTNNHITLPRQSDGYIKEPIADAVDIEASLDLYYLDSSLVDLMLNKTKFDVSVKFTRGTNDTIEFQLLGCVVTTESELPAEGEISQTLRLMPDDLKIVVVDNISSY